MQPTISAHDVMKAFISGRGKAQHVTEVIKGVNVSVMPGEMVSIVGPSGSGKSSLLYCLSGLEAADSGSIELMGIQVVRAGQNTLSRLRSHHVGFIFQSYNLIPSLSAIENVLLPARLAKRPITAAKAREVLRGVGLDGKEKNLPGALSGGEQQRVAVARVLACNPTIVFADEPTGALDSQNGNEVLQMLREIANNPKRSVILVTHDLEAASLADRVLVLRDGQIIREMQNVNAKRIFEMMGE